MFTQEFLIDVCLVFLLGWCLLLLIPKSVKCSLHPSGNAHRAVVIALENFLVHWRKSAERPQTNLSGILRLGFHLQNMDMGPGLLVVDLFVNYCFFNKKVTWFLRSFSDDYFSLYSWFFWSRESSVFRNLSWICLFKTMITKKSSEGWSILLCHKQQTPNNTWMHLNDACVDRFLNTATILTLY